MLKFLQTILGNEKLQIIKENDTAELYFCYPVSFECFKSLYDKLKDKYNFFELRETETHLYFSIDEGNELYYFNYYNRINELTVVRDHTRNYLSFNSPCGEIICSPTVTSINLEDFGLSYAVRLSNGKFIVFDAGRDFPPDHEKLYKALIRGSNNSTPTVAAWIMTHAHSDHFFGFVGFMNTYGDSIKIESILYNFPEPTDTERYPGLLRYSLKFGPDCYAALYINRMRDIINKYKIPTFTPHTGQIYKIGDAVCEVISTFDDCVERHSDINTTSTVIRMELAGQVILWAADASFSAAKIPEKYEKYLKSDILQVPHHGFGMGNEDILIKGYDLIDPKTCLLPVSSYNDFTVFSTFKKSTRYLFTKLNVEEVIVGDPERTITLPYTPPPYAKKELDKAVLSGIDNCGSRTWVFTELNTSNEDDLQFTLINLTNEKITVDAEMFFEERQYNVRHIRAEIDPYCLKKIYFLDETVKTEEVYYNPMSLNNVGIAEEKDFAVRFMSDQPFIASHSKRKATYYTPNIL